MPGRKQGTYAQTTRALMLLEHLAQRVDGVPLAELARRFAVTERQLRRDLAAITDAGHALEIARQERRSHVRLRGGAIRGGGARRFALVARAARGALAERLIVAPARPPSSAVLEPLLQAVLTSRLVRVRHRGAAPQLLAPHAVLLTDDGLVLVAHPLVDEAEARALLGTREAPLTYRLADLQKLKSTQRSFATPRQLARWRIDDLRAAPGPRLPAKGARA